MYTLKCSHTYVHSYICILRVCHLQYDPACACVYAHARMRTYMCEHVPVH